MNDSEFQAQVERIERLVQGVACLADEDARVTAQDLLQSLMDLHGAALARIVELLAGSGEAGRSSLGKLGSDPLVCGLLVLYGIHPVAIEDRVAQALEKAGPTLRKQGGRVELLGVAEGVVTVKLHASGQGCGSSLDALKLTVQQAILEAAPEVVQIVTEGVSSSASGFVPLSNLQPATKGERKYEESAA